MPEIAPFCGLRYNPKKIRDFSRVVIPPYDVISPVEQAEYYEASPYNMIRLELAQASPDDDSGNNPHTRAARCLRDWLRDSVLLKEDVPSVYYYELDYELPSLGRKTRSGFICALRLEDFSSGSVRPHEKTFQSVKDERLGLMLACHANLSPVFALYSDPSQEVDILLRAGREESPVVSFQNGNGLAHRIWRVHSPEVLRKVRGLMQEKPLFIADGHHRYETALNYRSIQRQLHPQTGPNPAFDFIMVYLSNMNQEGLTILPTHRLLRNLNGADTQAFLEKARELFEISAQPLSGVSASEWMVRLQETSACQETVIGMVDKSVQSFWTLRARREAVSAYLAGLSLPDPLRSLDVVVLDRVVLRGIMGLSDSFLADENNIHFKHDFAEALAQLTAGRYEVGFFINPTRMEQVQEVATAGLIMPHKSTYFYPKVGSGLVIRSLSADEEAIP